MLNFLPFIILLFASLGTIAQISSKLPNESTFSFVTRSLDKNAVLAGKQNLAKDTLKRILYFQLQGKNEGEHPIQEMTNTVTTMHMLYSVNGTQFIKYIIDTVAMTNRCWAPVAVDSLLFINFDNDPEDEMAIVLQHYPYCDAFRPYIQILFYDDLSSFDQGLEIRCFDELAYNIYSSMNQDYAEIKKSIVSQLIDKGLLNH